jgi:hypothetical protein
VVNADDAETDGSDQYEIVADDDPPFPDDVPAAARAAEVQKPGPQGSAESTNAVAADKYSSSTAVAKSSTETVAPPVVQPENPTNDGAAVVKNQKLNLNPPEPVAVHALENPTPVAVSAPAVVAQPTIGPHDALRHVVWGPDPMYRIKDDAPEVPIDPARFEQIMALKRQPLVRRLLLDVHYVLSAHGRLSDRVSLAAVARRVWGTDTRPDNWRRTLRSVTARATQTPHGPAFKYCDDDRVEMSVPPEFFGALASLIQPDQTEGPKLVLRKRNPDPAAKVSVKQLQYLRDHGWDSDDGGKPYRDGQLREIVRHYRRDAANLPTLGKLAREDRPYRIIFVPAVLGRANLCSELGDLVNLLVDNHTRWPAAITEGQIASGGKVGTTIACDKLDAAVEYEVFAGNSGGRGYKAATWGHNLGIDEVAFLKRLDAARDHLGLITVGVDRDNKLYGLQELIESPYAREKANVRVYVAKGFRRRWAEFFDWQRLRPADTTAATSPETDRAILRQAILTAGLTAVANAAGVAKSNLSTYLRRGRGLSAGAVARVRAHVLGSTLLTPDLVVDALTECTSLRDFAVGYARLRWCVVPLDPGTRKPHVKWKDFQTARPTIDQVRKWWTTWPDAAIGVLLGPISGLLVLDADGLEADAAAWDLLGNRLNGCPLVLSGSREPGHVHYYFRHPDIPTGAKNTDLHPDLEIRGAGGMIIVPPSVHSKSGHTYDWVNGQAIWQIPLPETPPEIVEILTAADALRKESRAHARVIAPADDSGFDGGFSRWKERRVPDEVAAFLRGEYANIRGCWNDRIFNAARWCRDHGVPQPLAEQVLVAGAGPTGPAEEAKALLTIRSAYAYSRGLPPAMAG